MKRTVKGPGQLFCILLSGLLLLSASGCRPSMTFTEIVYDQTVDQMLDEAMLEQLDNDIENEDKDDSIASVAEDEEADTERGRNRQDPSPGNGDASQSVPNARQDLTLMNKLRGKTPQNTGSGSGGAPQGTADSPGSGPSQGEQNGGAGEGGSNGGAGSGPGGAGTDGPGSGDSSGGNPGSGNGPGGTEEGGGLHQIVDINGRVVEIPNNISSLTATGELALIVEMLGGGDKLSASSASLKDGMAGRMFGNGWSGSVLWDGDGSAPMSDDRFAQLLNQAPQLCMMLSGELSFTEDQLRQLSEHNIQYMTLPPLTSFSGICEAVRITGEVLQAQDKASAYINYCNETRWNIQSMTEPFRPDGIDYDTGAEGLAAGSGVYALYISGWDASASYSLRHESVVLSGQGMATARTGYAGSPVTGMLSLAGVGNSAALKENNYVLNAPKIRFINPVINNLCTMDIQGGSQGATYKREYVMTTAGGFNLGDPEFPAVLAGTREAYEGILADKNRRGIWGEYPETQSPSGNTFDYGFLDAAGNLVVSTIHDQYDLYVIPSGAGSWSRGSVESILLPHWAAWRVRGIGTEAEVRSRIADFYQRFYGVPLSEADINEILAGH